MNIETAKQINLADYLHSLGYSPVKQQGINLWYKSPLRGRNRGFLQSEHRTQPVVRLRCAHIGYTINISMARD